jgi:hypothetical protein
MNLTDSQRSILGNIEEQASWDFTKVQAWQEAGFTREEAIQLVIAHKVPSSLGYVSQALDLIGKVMLQRSGKNLSL